MSELLTVMARPRANRTPSLKQTAKNTGTTVASLTVTLGQASNAGNLLVAFITANNIVTFTMPAGWVRACTTGTAVVRTREIWYYEGAPATSSLVITPSISITMAAIVAEFDCIKTLGALDQVGTGEAATGTTCSASTSAAAVQDALVVACAAGQAGATTFTPSATRIGTSTASPALDAQYSLSGVSAVQTLTDEQSTSQAWDMCIATFKRS